MRWYLIVVAALVALAACTTAPPTGPVSLLRETRTPSSGPTSTLFPTRTPLATAQQWASPPEFAIHLDQVYLAHFKTAKGEIVVELLPDKAPITVNSFIFLARQGYYDNTTFHRVLANFMAQGGDPTATGAGNPGYVIPDELHPDLTFDEPGLLAMANAGPNTGGSQFFITTVAVPRLNGGYTIFGKVVDGMSVLMSLTLRDPETNPDYPGDALETVEIEEVGESLLPPPTATPLPVAPEVEDGRPLADLEVADREDIYNTRPAMTIDTSKTYVATITTSKGDIVVTLNAAAAPESVNNFVVLANLGYWDNFPIVYADPTQFVLTGSPAGDPSSDIGYTLPSEVGQSNVPGAVGWYFRDDVVASSGSEFYIMLVDNPLLDSKFTVFGMVTEGLDVAGQLRVEDGDVIEMITIEEQ